MGIAAEALPAAAEAAEGAEGTAAAARPAGAGWRAVSRASAQAPAAARAAYSALPSAGQQRGTQILTRLVWAVALGLLVLDVAAQSTGQTWSWSLRGLGRQPAPKVPYQPLYAGMPMSPQDAALVGLHGVPSFRAPSPAGPGPLTGP